MKQFAIVNHEGIVIEVVTIAVHMDVDKYLEEKIETQKACGVVCVAVDCSDYSIRIGDHYDGEVFFFTDPETKERVNIDKLV